MWRTLPEDLSDRFEALGCEAVNDDGRVGSHESGQDRHHEGGDSHKNCITPQRHLPIT